MNGNGKGRIKINLEKTVKEKTWGDCRKRENRKSGRANFNINCRPALGVSVE
jgi:hypothetical protein